MKRGQWLVNHRHGWFERTQWWQSGTIVHLSTEPARKLDKIDLTFSNTKQAYKSKRTYELFRGILVLTISQFDFIVQNHDKIIKLSRAILGPSLFRKLMESTFYGQFVAGEDAVKIKPVLNHLRSFGVKSILDYSAEEDMTESEGKPKAVARTYFYRNEANCEKNMEIFLKSIDAVAGVTNCTGLGAIKMTALGRPELLLHVSDVIAECRRYFREITGKHQMVFGHVSPEEFAMSLETKVKSADKAQIEKFIKQMDFDKLGLMNLFSWNGLIEMKTLVNDLFLLPNLNTGKMEKIGKKLQFSHDEEEMFRNMMRRLHTVARHAKERDVRVLVDAEQTYFQHAINRLTMELMRKYNKEKAIIFNTYQCYLKDSHNMCQIDASLAERQGFYFGAKLVRGAYMDQERLRAKEMGYDDPINPDYEATSDMYRKNLNFFMNQMIKDGIENNRYSIMVCSHNADTVRHTIRKMDELGIKPEHRAVCFGQLYGMSDHISFNLGQSGYSIYKYVPYGPIDEVMPYLSRRAQENHGFVASSKGERILMLKEILRRFITFQWFYKPVGRYTPS
ncbi:hypothetical protein BLOT_011358 [Blomia tropicalis]|nr:hypothetical protein BLOT_011358 [Blomia tropicalis]